MNVKNCRGCGKLFNYIGGPNANLCPDCIRSLEDKFVEVKEYLDEHRSASMNEISRECEVSTKQIEKWVREERLVFSDDSSIGIGCEICGATIKSGRYCDACKANVVNKLDNAYEKPKATAPAKKAARDAARMRFLDNK